MTETFVYPKAVIGPRCAAVAVGAMLTIAGALNFTDAQFAKSHFNEAVTQSENASLTKRNCVLQEYEAAGDQIKDDLSAKVEACRHAFAVESTGKRADGETTGKALAAVGAVLFAGGLLGGVKRLLDARKQAPKLA